MNVKYEFDDLLNEVLKISSEDWEELVDRRRIWSQIDRSGGKDSCWNWIGCLDNNTGYGAVYYHGKTNRSHRVIYMITFGFYPIVVRHKCDNRKCCNPQHLEAGTHADNVKDWQTRLIDQKGEHNFASILTENQVKEIRQRVLDGEQQKKLAKEFGVNAGTINQIVHGWSWKHSFNGQLKSRKHRKLLAVQIERIRMDYNPKTISQNQLAKKYGVSRATIRRILIGEYK